MKKPKKKHGPLKTAFQLTLEKLGQTEADKINAIYQNASPAQKTKIVANLLKMQGASGMVGSLPIYFDGPINCKCVPSDFPKAPLDEEGIKMVVVKRFVSLLEAYGLPHEGFVPEDGACARTVLYCLDALKAGRCVAIRRVAVNAEGQQDGTTNTAHTFHAKALPLPAK